MTAYTGNHQITRVLFFDATDASQFRYQTISILFNEMCLTFSRLFLCAFDRVSTLPPSNPATPFHRGYKSYLTLAT